MKNVWRVVALVMIAALGWIASAEAQGQGGSPAAYLYCYSGTSPTNPSSWAPCNGSNPLSITGSFSATTTGFPGTTQTTGTPISVTTGGVTGTLPAGAVVVASNVGSTNGAYCKLGASATTSDQLIPPNSWFAFTVGSNTQLTCITSTSTTTVNMVGGSGLPTGSGGGGGGSGGNVNVSQIGGTNTVTPPAGAGNMPVDWTTGSQAHTDATAPLPVLAGTLPSTQTPVSTGSTTKAQSDLNGNQYANVISQYPAGATAITASATGTTAATTATLAASASLKTYICGFSIRANATAAATGNATVTGTVTGTLNFTQWTAPLASGLGVSEMIFTPCVPSSAINTAVAVVSAAPGSGGVVSSTAWGYQAP